MSANFKTGETIFDVIASVNPQNNSPVTGATFDIDVFRNGAVETGITISISLTEPSTGVFTSSFSASTIGDYQVFYKNNSTTTIFVTDLYRVKLDSEFETKIFVGL